VRNVQECKAVLAPMELKVVWQRKTSSVKSATAPITKELRFASNVKNFLAKPQSKDPSAMGTANTFRANPNR
jgi:hypothetical protein